MTYNAFNLPGRIANDTTSQAMSYLAVWEDDKGNIKSGWVKWKRNEILLIGFYYFA
ncbi:hypothetical protein QWY85_04545 [Neolewinella lacunae]|uniref:Uncharacterized protein n=1 Tax=Neolewinella lacunae TaxID=1517758 RepID=A0A923PPX7_9BACT|nr:hypothetical protein [Neolewinella lacunae]MBC6994567.1 hypothetical protein [Neolewinella lacunae]MDN3633916.1 hypothetical protein [Neolewinella lacunae]